MACDPTEQMRRKVVQYINAAQLTKSELESGHGVGNVWTTAELSERFEVIGFMAPFCAVRDKLTGKRGSVMFQHSPRLYFAFTPDADNDTSSGGW